MAIILGWIVFAALVGLTVMQSVYVWIHCRFLRSEVEAEFGDAFAPDVAIVLCLRGSDPSLVDCLAGLARLDYENFEVHIVVDEDLDPALNTVREFFASHELEKPFIHVMRNHSVTRSLKCSALITAIENMNNAVEVVAFIDADTAPDTNWLKDLVRPLADPNVGATTGNRWFTPQVGNLGSAVRKVWNAAAVPQISFYQIPWGGSLAIKRSTITKCDLLNLWGNAFCEDTMLTDVLARDGLRMVRVPNLISANDEATSLPSAFSWIVRQLLTVRLYHRDWPLVLAHGFFTGTCLIAVVVAIVMLWVQGDRNLASALLFVLILFECCLAVLLVAIQKANERVIRGRGYQATPNRHFGKQLLAIPITQIIHPVAVLTAALTTRVSWRGITYAIGANKSIEMVRYQPYRESNDALQAQEITSSID